MLNSGFGLVFEVWGFGSLQNGGMLGENTGAGELRNSIDENLAGRRTDGERMGVPEDYVWG